MKIIASLKSDLKILSFVQFIMLNNEYVMLASKKKNIKSLKKSWNLVVDRLRIYFFFLNANIIEMDYWLANKYILAAIYQKLKFIYVYYYFIAELPLKSMITIELKCSKKAHHPRNTINAHQVCLFFKKSIKHFNTWISEQRSEEKRENTNANPNVDTPKLILDLSHSMCLSQ